MAFMLVPVHLKHSSPAIGCPQRSQRWIVWPALISLLDLSELAIVAAAVDAGAAAARGTFYAVLVYNGKTYVGVKEGKVAATSSGL